MNHIFISYSRKDMDGAQKIVDALSRENLETWIDWNSIPKGEDWEQEIYRGIEQANAFLFLISPDSIRSEMCNREILHAIKNKKRILPILLRTADMNEFLHPEAGAEIQRLNWISCRAGLDDFPLAIQHATETIRTDYDWVRFHTMLQVKALAWEQARRDGSRLLRGGELSGAEARIKKNAGRMELALTEVQEHYIAESRRAVRRRQTLPITIVLALGLAVFVGERLFYLVLPVSSACPAVRQVTLNIENSDLPQDIYNRLFAAYTDTSPMTVRRNCSSGAEGVIEVQARSVPGSKPIELHVTLPSTPAYTLDFLPEIREFGPEALSEKETAALLSAFPAYALGDYQAAIKSLEGYNSLSALTLKAQAYLFIDKPDESREAYTLALETSPLDEETEGRLLAGIALAGWRPETYYQLTFEGRRQDCLTAGGYYATPNDWLEVSPLAKNIRTAYALYCVNDQDSLNPAYAPYAAWRDESPIWENDSMAQDAELTNAIGHFIEAFRIRQDPAASPDEYIAEISAAEPLLLARASLSEYYSAVKENCVEARRWREAYRSGILSALEKRKLQKLLQAQPLFCR